jgi:hypothetical protein
MNFIVPRHGGTAPWLQIKTPKDFDDYIAGFSDVRSGVRQAAGQDRLAACAPQILKASRTS